MNSEDWTRIENLLKKTESAASPPESSLVLKWWGVIGLFIAALSFLYISDQSLYQNARDNRERIVKLEVITANTHLIVSDMSKKVDEIRQDQIRRASLEQYKNK